MYIFTTPSFRQRHTLLLLYVTLFVLVFGESIQIAPRLQVYESIICRDRTTDGLPLSSLTNDNRCKSRPVQEELAFLTGMERLTGVFPTIMALPFGVFADRYGRSFVLTLALMGLALEQTWTILICSLSQYVSLRLVLLGVVFEFIGGGVGVVTTMAHVIAADIVSAESRTSTFFLVRAVGIAAAIVGQLTGSTLMDLDTWLPFAVGISALFLSTGISCLVVDPISKGSTQDPSPVMSPSEETGLIDSAEDGVSQTSHNLGFFKDCLKTAPSLMGSAARVIAGNSRLVLLLLVVFVCWLSEESISAVLLLYISKRFGWTFSKANLLWALEEAIQMVFLVLLLPALNRSLSQVQHMPVWNKDLRLAQTSVSVLGIGSLLLGIGARIGVVIAGIVPISMATGLQSIMRSLITETIRPQDLSVVYSGITVLHVLGTSLSGPLYSGVFAAGLRLGKQWTGLPFILSGAFCVIALLLLYFVAQKPPYQLVARDDEEEIED